MSRTSTPPTLTLPESTSQKRGTRLAAVVLPPPEGPTSATVEPAGTSKLMSTSASPEAPGYAKPTCSKEIEPSRGCPACTADGSASGLVASISSMRRTESCAIITASLAYIIFVIMVVVMAENTA